MKRAYAAPLAVLTALLVFSFWNSHYITRHVQHWQDQLQAVTQYAGQDDWQTALDLLNSIYDDWSANQTYLHIVTQHSAVNDAEAMFRRAAAFAATNEITEFQAEAADLEDQLQLIAEMEQFRLGNILTSLPAAYSALP